MSSVKLPLPPLELIYLKNNFERDRIDYIFLDLWKDNSPISRHLNSIMSADEVVLTSAPFYPYWRDGIKNPSYVNRVIDELRNHTSAKILVAGPHGNALPDTINAEVISGEIEEYYRGKHTVENMDNLNLTYESGYSCVNLPNTPRLKPYYYESSRGCLNNCIFCNRKGFRDSYREMSMDKVKRDINYLADVGVDYVFCIDENMGLNYPRTLSIAKEFYKYGILWGCQISPEKLSSQRVDSLVKYGLSYLYTGVESYNPKVRQGIGLKGCLKVPDLSFLKGYPNLRVLISCIAGLPHETSESLAQTSREIYQLTHNNPHISAGCSIAMPYPQTRLGDLGGVKSWGDMIELEGTIGNDLPKDTLKQYVQKFNRLFCTKKPPKKGLIAIPSEQIYKPQVEAIQKLRGLSKCDVLYYNYTDEPALDVPFYTARIPRPIIPPQPTSWKIPPLGKTQKELSFIAHLRNYALSLVREGEYEYVLFIDADVAPPPDTLDLLDIGGDIVGGWYPLNWLRVPPVDFRKEVRQKVSEGGTVETRLVPGGCMLVYRHVAEHLSFYSHPTKYLAEDEDFCKRATNLGYRVVCVGKVKCNHLTIG